jgi:hypothetical protein
MEGKWNTAWISMTELKVDDIRLDKLGQSMDERALRK